MKYLPDAALVRDLWPQTRLGHDPAAQHTQAGRRQRAQVGARVGVEHDEVGGRALGEQRLEPEPATALPRRGRDHVGGRAGPCRPSRGPPRRGSRGGRCRRRRCRRRARRRPRARPAGSRAGGRGGRPSWRRRPGTCRGPGSANVGNLSVCSTVGTSATPPATIASRWCSRRPVPCSMQSMPAASSPSRTSLPKQWAVTLAPSACAAAMAAANASAGNDGARSPASREIQSPTSLTQPSPARACSATVRGEVVGLDLVGVVADVAAGAGHVAPGPDQPRQVVALLHPPGVGRRAAVAQQQHPGVAVGDAPGARSRRRRPRRRRRGRGGCARRPGPGSSQPLATVSAPACGS